MEPGFAGLSFQVIRRNPRAYALYREAADAFTAPAVADEQPRAKRRGDGVLQALAAERLARPTTHSSASTKKSSSADSFSGDGTGRRAPKRSALAYDQQALLAKMIRLETEIILLQAERSQ